MVGKKYLNINVKSLKIENRNSFPADLNGHNNSLLAPLWLMYDTVSLTVIEFKELKKKGALQ